MVISIAYVIEITTFPLILGGLSQSIDLSENTAYMLVSSYKFALVASIIFAGWIGDRYSREAVFTAGAALFFVASVAILMSPALDTMLPLRILQGIGAGLFSPMIPALLAARKPDSALSALGAWGMLTGAAAAVYPFIAAYLTTHFNWQAGWAVIPIFAGLALLGLPRPSDRKTAAKKDPASSTNPFQSTGRLSRHVWALLLYIFLNYGLTTWFMVAVSLIGAANNVPLTTIGLILFVVWSVFSLMNLAISILGQRLRLKQLLLIGALVNSIGVVIFAMWPETVGLHFLAAILIGTGMALNNAPTTDLAFRMSDAAIHGRIASYDIIAARLGGAVFVLTVPVTGMWVCCVAAACMILSFGLTHYSGKGVRVAQKPDAPVLS
ncbi:MFS transporter [Algirhabdus cladophorae]|uniref:MFS transporter n=1 Tax=Algirhabdus cladophorae TaxID=3377108 RepID=UPI003B84AF10